MAPPVFFIDPADDVDAQATISLTGDEARHAAKVMRLRVGEPVHLVDGVGRRLEGEVCAVSRDRVDVRIAHSLIEPEPSPRIVVVQALAKGDRGERAVAVMTEVGVDVIVPWSADHCVTRWIGERAVRGADRWRSTARASAKQARRARTPDIRPVHDTADLEPWIRGSALAVCLDESADEALAAMRIPAAGDITLIVGPEGGLSDGERDLLGTYGAHRASMGPNVLRTSTAGPVGAAVVLARTPRWGGPA